jgi:hypothetical protein
MSNAVAEQMPAEPIAGSSTVTSESCEQIILNKHEDNPVVILDDDSSETTVDKLTSISRTKFVDSVIPHYPKSFVDVLHNGELERTKMSPSSVSNENEAPDLSNRNKAPSNTLTMLAAELQKPASSKSSGPGSIAEAAHNAFLASQPGPHPLLQQIENISQIYGKISLKFVKTLL